MPLGKLTIRLDSTTRDALQQRAESASVTLGSYVGAVLERHLEQPAIAVEARPRGLANVGKRRRERLAAGARRAKNRNKGDNRG